MSEIPDEMWFGTIVGQWPIQCWESETHALAWYAKPAADGYHKKLWKAKVSDPVQFEAVIPKPYLQRKGLTGEGGDAR